MGGQVGGNQHQFTGIAKYFNSYTITGRRNCVLLTHGSLLAIILYNVFKSKKQEAVTEK